MLQQNWFYTENMIPLDEYFDGQLFYDKNSKCFYKVYEDYRGRTNITQYAESDTIYDALYKQYEMIVSIGSIDNIENNIILATEFDCVALINGRYLYFEININHTPKINSVKELTLLAKMTYSISTKFNNNIELQDILDSDVCGEQVGDDAIHYWYFAFANEKYSNITI